MRSLLKNSLKLNWPLGLFLILLLGIPRFIIVLEANKTGNYGLTSVLFVLMIVLPFLLLNRNNRRMIGLKRPAEPWWLLYSLLAGVLVGALVYYLGNWLYGDSGKNWFVYISRSYTVPGFGEGDPDRIIYFLIFAAVGMTFSPFGEEFFYRGLIHQSFVPSLGENGASVADSAAFAVTHLAHFGILYTVAGFIFVPGPALVWVLLMYFTSRVFFLCKVKTGSLFGAVAAHAGFNLAMTWFIFYRIL